MKRNYYAEAIEVISQEQDWRAMIVEIAKTNPSVIANCSVVTSVTRKIQVCYDNKGKIDAIKLHRQLTGSSLKDAKEAVEAACQ